jgi:hypothetical protein
MNNVIIPAHLAGEPAKLQLKSRTLDETKTDVPHLYKHGQNA